MKAKYFKSWLTGYLEGRRSLNEGEIYFLKEKISEISIRNDRKEKEQPLTFKIGDYVYDTFKDFAISPLRKRVHKVSNVGHFGYLSFLNDKLYRPERFRHATEKEILGSNYAKEYKKTIQYAYNHAKTPIILLQAKTAREARDDKYDIAIKKDKINPTKYDISSGTLREFTNEELNTKKDYRIKNQETMRILGDRVMIKKLNFTTVSKSGLTIAEDGDALPKGQVIIVSSNVEDLVEVRDIVYYTDSRETGKCIYNDEEHFIINIGNIIAIL